MLTGFWLGTWRQSTSRRLMDRCHHMQYHRIVAKQLQSLNCSHTIAITQLRSLNCGHSITSIQLHPFNCSHLIAEAKLQSFDRRRYGKYHARCSPVQLELGPQIRASSKFKVAKPHATSNNVILKCSLLCDPRHWNQKNSWSPLVTSASCL